MKEQIVALSFSLVLAFSIPPALGAPIGFSGTYANGTSTPYDEGGYIVDPLDPTAMFLLDDGVFDLGTGSRFAFFQSGLRKFVVSRPDGSPFSISSIEMGFMSDNDGAIGEPSNVTVVGDMGNGFEVGQLFQVTELGADEFGNTFGLLPYFFPSTWTGLLSITFDFGGADFLGVDNIVVSPAPSVVPLPAALPMLLVGLIGLVVVSRRKLAPA